MKILFAYNSGCNLGYLLETLLLMVDVTPVSLSKYLSINQDEFDCLIYQTYPEEKHRIKFNKELIDKTDRKFLEFKKLKVLFDAHDESDKDAYSRFANYEFPRIKNAPALSYYEKFNVILETTFPIIGYPPIETNRHIPISYIVTKNRYFHTIREDTAKILQLFSVDTTWKKNYREYLQNVLISVVCPGYGIGTFRHLETLNAGCLLLSHESLKEIKILPHADLVEDEDYVSFNLDNLKDKLNYLQKNRKLVDKIRINGQTKFYEGYSYIKSVTKLKERLQDEMFMRVQSRN